MKIRSNGKSLAPVEQAISELSAQVAPHIYNADKLPNLLAAINSLKAGGTLKYHIFSIGDSYMTGQGSTDPLNLGWFGLLRDEIFMEAWQDDTGKGAMGAFYPNYSTLSNHAYTGVWGMSTEAIGLGGRALYTGTNGATITRAFSGTEFSALFAGKVEYPSIALGTVSIAIDGGAAETVDLNTQNVSVYKYSKTGLTAGDHTAVITAVLDSSYLVFLGSSVAKGSKGFVFHNLAVGGTRTTDWNTTKCLATVDAFGYDPTLTIIGLGGNDHFYGVSIANYKTNLAALVAKGKETGDVILVCGGAFNASWKEAPEYVPVASQDAFRDAMFEVAGTDTCLIDYYGSHGGNADALIAWGLCSDGVHLTNAGQRDLKSHVIKPIRRCM